MRHSEVKAKRVDDRRFMIAAAIWGPICIGSAAFFYLNRNAALKRKVYVPFVVVFHGLFLALGWFVFVDAPREFLIVAVPIVVLVTLLNIRAGRFCDSCGRS